MKEIRILRPSISEDVLEMMWKLATRGNSEHCYLQVVFSFARALGTGMVDKRKHLPLIPKVASSNPVIESFYLSLSQSLTLTLPC